MNIVMNSIILSTFFYVICIFLFVIYFKRRQSFKSYSIFAMFLYLVSCGPMIYDIAKEIGVGSVVQIFLFGPLLLLPN